MACQPAIDICIPLKMTGDAIVHIPHFAGQPVQVLHLPVALLAGNLVVDMPLMIEQNVLGNIVHFFPGRWLIGIEIFMFFLDPGMLLDNVVVAVQTQFHGGQSGPVRVGHIGMAILALYLFYAAVNVVAERNWLLRSDVQMR